MNKSLTTIVLVLMLFIISGILTWQLTRSKKENNPTVLATHTQQPDEYWFLLERKSKQELLFKGTAGDKSKSIVVKQFKVNVGVENERPTPLPQLMGREYWHLIAKYEVKDDPETAPYFLTLDIPWSDEYPFGPTPYTECNGFQCDWVRPGSFGLHGIAGNPEKLVDHGSSGCIRHTDEDITYLYNLLDPEKQPIRYYIEDV